MEQTACLCKMLFLPPFVVHGSLGISKDEVLKHRNDLHDLYDAFIHSEIDVEKIASLHRINADMSLVLVKLQIPG
jgi:hypothetical protein